MKMSMKKFYVGVKAVIRDKNRGFIVLKAKKGHMDIPGGRINGDETFEQTIKRGVSEELPGAKVLRVNRLLGSYRVKKNIEDNTGLVLLYFLVDANIPEKIKLSREHSSFVWVKRVDDIPEGLNPEIAGIIRELLRAQDNYTGIN